MERPDPRAVLELLKPITWFAPMWAFCCGVVSSGEPVLARWPMVLGGVILAGPLVCASSQAVNDWFDRHVDAINEPNRPIPSGRIPGQWGLLIAIGWSALSLGVASLLGPWVLRAAIVGLILAWAYSAPPFRLKQNGWWGNAAVGICYEGLPWFTGAAVMTDQFPEPAVVILGLLYSIGAHGIMTLNDFKSVAGDRATGIGSLPVRLGVARAAQVACLAMFVPQLVVAVLLAAWDRPLHALAIAVLLLGQAAMMRHFLAAPSARARWYSGFGVPLFVAGMLVAAFGSRGGGA